MVLSPIIRPSQIVEAQEFITEFRDEYYSKPGHGKQYDQYPETGYYSNSGSGMQTMRPYPNIATSQPPNHHAVAREDYYGKPHNYGKTAEYDTGYYGNHSDYKPNHYGHGYENKPQYSYEGYGHGRMYPDGPNRFEPTTGYNYYAENRQRLGQNGRGAEAAKWIARRIDD